MTDVLVFCAPLLRGGFNGLQVLKQKSPGFGGFQQSFLHHKNRIIGLTFQEVKLS